MQKSPDAFRTISEVASDLDIPQHVLRFWETRFPSIRPLKRGGGRRYYRPDDVDLLKGIRQLLYGQGYTIRGVQRILKEDGLRFVQAVGRGEQAVAAAPPAPDDADEADAPGVAAYEGGSEAQEFYTGDGSSDLDRLSGQPLAHTSSLPTSPALSPEDLERLRQTLDELHECERILGSLRAPN